MATNPRATQWSEDGEGGALDMMAPLEGGALYDEAADDTGGFSDNYEASYDAPVAPTVGMEAGALYDQAADNMDGADLEQGFGIKKSFKMQAEPGFNSEGYKTDEGGINSDA